MAKKKNAIEMARDLYSQFRSGVGNAMQNFNQPRQVTRPLIQTPLANVQPINYGQVAQNVGNFYQQQVQPRLQQIQTQVPRFVQNVGQQLQRVPDLQSPKLFGVPLINPMYGRNETIRSAGKTIERIGQRKFAQGGFGNAFEDVANVASVLPIGRLAKVGKVLAPGLEREAMMALSYLKSYDRLNPSAQIEVLSRIANTAKKVIPDVVGTKEVKKLAGRNPTEWRNVMAKFMEDRLVQSKNPSFDMGFSVRTLGKLKGKPVFNNKQSQAIQQSFISQLDSLRQTATSAEDLATKTNQIVNNAIRQSNGDKTVLAGIRTALNKDLQGYAGGTGNYKSDYSLLQTLKSDPSIAPHIDSLETNIANIDNLLLQPQQPISGIKGKALQISTQAEKKLSPSERTKQQVQEARVSARQTSGGGSIRGAGGKSPQAPSVPSPSKYAYNINKQRLQATPEQKKTLEAVTNAVKPELERIKGKTLSNDEVIRAAKTSDMLQQVTTREQTLQAEAAVLKARQRMVELNNNIDRLAREGKTTELQSQMRDLIDSLRVVSGNAADTGRKLQSLAIEAGEESLRIKALREIAQVNNNTDEILREAGKVDWNNANSIATFYRKFIPPSFTNVLDEFRYNNMLSSPKTHIRNAFSNLMQTFITRPATILVEGKPVEAAKYFTGVMKSFPDAIKAFRDSFSGKIGIQKPDISMIPTKKLPFFMTIPTRAMEAGDKFFSALIKGGEIARGTAAEQAANIAEYSLFRQMTNPKGQGAVLNAIDSLTNWTYNAPKVVRWFVPFIRTPMNFAKQWIEFSPAGFTTAIGSSAPREQIAKALIGSTVTAFGAMLALQGKTTWSAPTDPKQKDYFYSSGRKPFSIQIGDRWIPMQYAGPFSLSLAMPAAMKYYQEDNRTALTDSQLEKGLKVTSGLAQFFSQQTFLSGIGNFVNWASGSPDISLGSSLGFTAQQVIPMEALIAYVNQIIDPVYRKANSFAGSIQKNIPIASQFLEPYRDALTGEVSKRLPENYVLPYDTGKVNPQGEEFLQLRTEKLQNNAIINKQKKDIERQLNSTNPLQAEAAEESSVMKNDNLSQQKSKLQEDLVKQRVEMTGNPEWVNEKFYYLNENGNRSTIDFSTPITPPKFTGYEDIDKVLTSKYSSRLTTEINNLIKLAELKQITYQQASELIKPIKAEQEQIKIRSAKPKQPKAIKPKKITARRVSVRKTAVPKPIKLKIKTNKVKLKKYKPLPRVNFKKL